MELGVEYLREKFREGKFAAPKDKTEALERVFKFFASDPRAILLAGFFNFLNELQITL